MPKITSIGKHRFKILDNQIHHIISLTKERMQNLAYIAEKITFLNENKPCTAFS